MGYLGWLFPSMGNELERNSRRGRLMRLSKQRRVGVGDMLLHPWESPFRSGFLRPVH